MQIAFKHTDPAAKLTEAELVEGCRMDNARMQRELYDRFRRTMYGVCLRYTDNRDDAMDVLQEGFIRGCFATSLRFAAKARSKAGFAG